MGSRSKLIPASGPYEQLEVEYDLENRVIWCYLAPSPRPCFNPTLLSELEEFQRWLRKACAGTPHDSAERGGTPVGYFVAASRTPGVFNLGGDLELFLRCIESGDRARLEAYAEACIDVVHRNATCLGVPWLTTISLVQGQALGGGFEAAISSSIVIAEEQATFGLPEILFNLIPGMGAYSFLSRKLDRARAERLILGGKIYGAAEMHEMGVVDVLAPKGEGKRVTSEFIRRHARRANAHQALARARSRLGEVTREELLDITRYWVNAAMSLDRKDLRIMRRLVDAQNHRTEREDGSDAQVMYRA